LATQSRNFMAMPRTKLLAASAFRGKVYARSGRKIPA
jgi:hypothetical protein